MYPLVLTTLASTARDKGIYALASLVQSELATLQVPDVDGVQLLHLSPDNLEDLGHGSYRVLAGSSASLSRLLLKDAVSGLFSLETGKSHKQVDCEKADMPSLK